MDCKFIIKYLNNNYQLLQDENCFCFYKSHKDNVGNFTYTTNLFINEIHLSLIVDKKRFTIHINGKPFYSNLNIINPFCTNVEFKKLSTDCLNNNNKQFYFSLVEAVFIIEHILNKENCNYLYFKDVNMNEEFIEDKNTFIPKMSKYLIDTIKKFDIV
ncbi:MAG: hypothetical protein QW478_00345 [Candidatus Micrarchaeaceae archaeon]